MSQTADAVVIGAGIVGAACARALTLAGLDVVVVDPSVIGGGATAAGMGHVVVMDEPAAEFELTRRGRELWAELAPGLPPEVEYRRTGTIWVAADDEEMDAVRRKHAAYSAGGVASEILDARALAAAEPNLRAGLAGGLLVPDDVVLYAPYAAAWLLGQVRVVPRRVVGLAADGVELDDGRLISAPLVICATGAAAAELVPECGVRPRKGHLIITDRYPGFVHHQLIELGYLKSAHGSGTESVAFNVQPRATGQILLGSSRQFGVATDEVDWPVLRRMTARAFEYMPGLANLLAIRIWTGFRAATHDGLPLIGPCPGRPNVLLATGHEGLGITTALATAERIAAHAVSERVVPAGVIGAPRPPAPVPHVPAITTCIAGGEGATLAAARAKQGIDATRTSVSGEPRGPLCGMGICFECRVTVDGQPHVRACQTPAREGMEVRTGGG